MNFEKEVQTIDPDIQDYIFKKGYKAGNEHNTPSPETLIKLAKMGEDITILKVGQGKIEVKLDSIIETLECHIDEESEYRRQQDAFHKQIIDSKADKWVQTAVATLISLICLGVFGVLLEMVIGK